MKLLNVYLYKSSVRYMTYSLDEFNNAIDKIIENKEKDFCILNTYCLAALDFNYFKIFDKIQVLGKYMEAEFIIKDKENLDILDNAIIDYHVYDHQRNDFTYLFEKELRYSHNLYNLVTRGYFDLLNKGIDLEYYLNHLSKPLKEKGMSDGEIIVVRNKKDLYDFITRTENQLVKELLDVEQHPEYYPENAVSIVTTVEDAMNMKLLKEGYEIILVDNFTDYLLNSNYKKYIKVYLNDKDQLCLINSSQKILDIKENIHIDGSLKAFMKLLYVTTE